MIAVKRPGYDALWGWFSLSYASWLTLPRVLMHEMPDDWQARMAQLLSEFDAAWEVQDMGTRVQAVSANGRFIAMPEWLQNYRRPDKEAISEARRLEELP